MVKTTIAALEHGFWRGGTAARQASLRAITGADELVLAELPPQTCLAERVTALIARTLVRVGDCEASSDQATELARDLTIGDRERLLFALHAASHESTPELTLVCSNPACREQLEIAIRLSDIVRASERPSTLEQTATLGDGAGVIRFRLPTGADQEAAALIAHTDPERAGDVLFERCVIAIEDTAALDRTAARAMLAERLPALDPQAETIVETSCPACGAMTSVLVDAASLVFQSMVSKRGLLSEIDRIARTYHWSEAEILAMPVGRRRAYLTLIADVETAS